MEVIKRFLGIVAVSLVMSTLVPDRLEAQCAMCTLNAENSTKEGNMQGKGLNDGILFLLSMPFVIGIGIGVLWYKKFRVTTSEK